MPSSEAVAPEREEIKKAVECLLFIADQPLAVTKLRQCLGVKDETLITDLIAEVKQELEARGSAIQLVELAGGFQMATRTGYAPYIRKLFAAERMTLKLSQAAHETLSIIAYKQPLTRAEIEEVRGVEVIAALETLLEKRLIKVVGRKETVGRPLMYGTTPDFLRRFGLKGLEDLPPLEKFVAQSESGADQNEVAAPKAVGPFAPVESVEPLDFSAVTPSPTLDSTIEESNVEPSAEPNAEPVSQEADPGA